MKKLSVFELANVKRVSKSVNGFYKKLSKLEAQKANLEEEISSVRETIELYEAPVIKLTGGFTSQQVLSGEMEAEMAKVETAAEVDESPIAEEVTPEVPVEEVPQVTMEEDVIHIEIPAEGGSIDMNTVSQEGGIPLFGNSVNF